MALEISSELGVGHIDGGLHRPLVHAGVNVVVVQRPLFFVTSASASRRAASAAWNARFISFVLATIFSCIKVLFIADTPRTARTSRNISAGNSDIPDCRARGIVAIGRIMVIAPGCAP